MESFHVKCRLKELRIARGMTQTGIAMELNVSQQTISRIEMKESEIPIDLAIRAATYFSVSVEYILGLSEERRIMPVMNKTLHAASGHEAFMTEYMALPSEDKLRVSELIRELWDLQKIYEPKGR